MLKKIVWRIKDNLLQWFWFASTVDRDHIGYDRGLLTRLRVARHKTLRREVHICLLDVYPPGGKFGRFTSFWINEKSSICSASVNQEVEDADVVWIYSQDPLPSEIKQEISRMLGRRRPGTPVINHPDVYNSYHKEGCFRKLAESGISVPRSEFSEADRERTSVVYKAIGRHGAPKILSLYRGPINGYHPFECIDSHGPDGYYRKYRASYVLGIVHPHYAAYSDQPIVNPASSVRIDYGYKPSPLEVEYLKRIAQTLGLQYFSADYLLRSGDGHPFFTDINVYPQPFAFTEIGRESGYYGRWHHFDNRLRLGIADSPGASFWELFDETMKALTQR